MPNLLKTRTLLLVTVGLGVAVGVMLGVPGSVAQAQQPSADPPPDRPGAGQPGQPGATPRKSPGPGPRRIQKIPADDTDPLPPASTPSPTPTPTPTKATGERAGGGATSPVVGKAAAAKNGFVLQLNLGTDFVSSALGAATMMYSYLYGGGPGLNGSFSMGYRLYRWVFTMGFDFRRFETEDSEDKIAVSVVTFRPSVAVDLVSTYPVALYLTFGMPIGFLASDGRNGGYYMGSNNDLEPVVGFVVGLGARYFFHPQFAIGMEGAFKGLWVFVETEDYYDDGERVTVGNVAFSGSIFMMAIF